MSNQTHSVEFSDYLQLRTQEIDAYDKLPKELREQVANSPFTISSKTVLRLWLLLNNLSMVFQAIKQIEQQMRDGVI